MLTIGIHFVFQSQYTVMIIKTNVDSISSNHFHGPLATHWPFGSVFIRTTVVISNY